LQARLDLLALVEKTMTREEFRDRYRLGGVEDASIVAGHFRLCLEMGEQIRWDLIFRVLFPEPDMESLVAASQGTEGGGRACAEAEGDDIRTLDSKVLYGKRGGEDDSSQAGEKDGLIGQDMLRGEDL
jgi:hypothetical protein